MKLVMLVSVIMMAFINSHVAASETFVKAVKVVKNSDDSYNFAVTLKHADKSWDHYANVWQVQSLDGKVLAKRVLHHPHINEQPFTRSLLNIALPNNIKKVEVVAGCTVDGINSKKYLVNLK